MGDTYPNFYTGKRVVVTGGGGFFGSHIVKKLQQAGAAVFVPRTKDGIDFRRPEDSTAYMEAIRPEFVIHCAAHQGGIGYHHGKQADLFKDNMQMGMAVMDAAHKAGVKKFVNIVAGCAYPGYLEQDVLEEEDLWNGAVHHSIFSYGFPRKASILYGLALAKQFGFRSIHLILANMYGPGDHFNPQQSKALPALIKKIYEAKKNRVPRVEIWGSGQPVRDWLYVEDGAEGVLRAGAGYNELEPLNIASGVGISVRGLAELIRDTIGYDGELFFDTKKEDGAMKKTFGIKKMEHALQWRPPTPLAAGVAETVDWFKNHYDYAISR